MTDRRLTIDDVADLFERAMQPRPRTPEGGLILDDREADALHERGAIIIQDGQKHSIIMTLDMKDKVQRIASGQEVDDPYAYAVVRMLAGPEDDR